MTQMPTGADFAKHIAGRGVIVGDPAHCIDDISYWRDTVGLTTISATIHYGGMPHETALANLRLFADRVIPAFR
jgi:hypothetical protein